jgi:hypothetical protein
MNPWEILGWFLVALVATWLLVNLIGPIIGIFWTAFHEWVLYRRTRNIPPEEGQVWAEGGKRIRIDRITENGRIVVKIGSMGSSISWSDSPEEWRERVKNRKLHLIVHKKREGAR